MRKRILDRIKAELGKIVAGSTYTNTLKKITYVYQNLSQLNSSDLPCIVLVGLESTAEVLEGLKTWTWRVGLLIYLDSEPGKGEAIITTPESMYADLITLFDSFQPDIAYGGISGVEEIESVEIMSLEPYLTFENGKTAMFAELEIIYNE